MKNKKLKLKFFNLFFLITFEIYFINNSSYVI
jgi:hypothetical protein